MLRSCRSSRVLIGSARSTTDGLVTAWCHRAASTADAAAFADALPALRRRPLALPARPLSGVGDRASSAQDSRCRSIGTCASQQFTEQNANAVRARLHVDTLQTQYAVRKGISFLQVLQRFQKADSIVLLPGLRREGQRCKREPFPLFRVKLGSCGSFWD